MPPKKGPAPPAPAAVPAPAAPEGKQQPKMKQHSKASASKNKCHSSPVADWLATGLLFHATGKSAVLNKFLTDIGKDYYGQLLLQVRGVAETDMKEVLVQHARRNAFGVGGTDELGSSGNGGKKGAKKKGSTTAPSSSSVPSSAPVDLSWTNAHLSSLKDPSKGGWETAKLYGPSLGPTSLAGASTTPEKTDVYSKLMILANYKAYSPLLGEELTAKAAALAQEWVGSTGWMKKDGQIKFDEAKATLTALLEGMAEVYPSVREPLTATLATLQGIQKKEDGDIDLTAEQVTAILTARVRPLVQEAWAAQKSGSKARQQAAEAALMALETAMDGESDPLEAKTLASEVREIKQKAQAQIEQAEKTDADKAAAAAQVLKEQAEAAAKEAALAKKSREQEEKDYEDAQQEAEEHVFWDSHFKHHPGLRDTTKKQVESFRVLTKTGKAKEVIREALVTLQQHQRGVATLLPVEVHSLQENMARAALLTRNLTLALSAIDKTFNGTDASLPPCYRYCPTSLRLKATILETQGEEEVQARLQGKPSIGDEDALPSFYEQALEAYAGLAPDERTLEDSVRRVHLQMSRAVRCYHVIKAKEDEEEYEATASTGVGYLLTALTYFAGEEQKEEGLTEDGWPLIPKEKEPEAYFQVNRLLAIFHAEDRLEKSMPEHFDEAIKYYQEALAWVARLLSRPSPRLLNYRIMHNGLRFELARVYIRRNQDITDEVQAMCLLEQLVPAMAPLLGQREDLARVYLFKGQLLSRMGRRDGDEPALRKALEAWEAAAETFDSLKVNTPAGKENKTAQIANVQAEMGAVYKVLASLAGKQGAGWEKEDEKEQEKKPELSPEELAARNVDYEKSINKYMLAYNMVHTVSEQGGKRAFECGQYAFKLGDMYIEKPNDKRARNLDQAIQWTEKGEQDIRRSTPDKRDTQDRYIRIYLSVYPKLAGLYTERAGLRKDKKEAAQKVADLKKAQYYGNAHDVMLHRFNQLTEAYLAAKAEQALKVEDGEEGEKADA